MGSHKVVGRGGRVQRVLQELDLRLLVRLVMLRAEHIQTSILRPAPELLMSKQVCAQMLGVWLTLQHSPRARRCQAAKTVIVSARVETPGSTGYVPIVCKHSNGKNRGVSKRGVLAVCGGRVRAEHCVPERAKHTRVRRAHVCDVVRRVVLLGGGVVRGDEGVGVEEDATDGDLRPGRDSFYPCGCPDPIP